MKRLIFLIIWSVIVPLFVLWPAYAQEGCGEAGDYYLENNWSVSANTSGISWSANGENWNVDCSSCGYTSPDYATLEADYSYRIHTGDLLKLYFGKNTSNNAMEVRGRIQLSSGAQITGTWTTDASFPNYITVAVPEDYDGYLADKIFIDVSTFRGPAFGESYTFYPASSYFTLSCPDIQGGSCGLITNSGFLTSTDWFLANEAVITDGYVTVPQTGIVAQNLTLESLTSYDAIISTTNNITTPGQLAVTLGGDTVLLDITEPGVYTASFTTPNLGGPIIYGFTTITELPIEVDYTCISLAPGSSGESGCLAPANGQFNDNSHWNWYRGAEWFYPAKSASLPLADTAMIGSLETYTMPALESGQHLLISFTVRGLADGGVVAGQLTNGGAAAEFTFPAYSTEYSYEANLDALAEEANVQVSFANPGDVITGVVSSADILVDNICIFTANRDANLPAPTDPDGITPIDSGLHSISSCADLDGIWAGFGVNMAQYRADYAAGTSVWDPLGWVPWLIAAIFVTLGNWACFFYAAFLNLVDLITYFLNSVMNIGNWLVRMWPLFVTWLKLWMDWLAGSLTNISNAIGNALAAWSDWIGNALWATSETIALTLAAASDWIGDSLANISNVIGNTLAAWSQWIGDMLAAWSEWIGNTLAVWSEWIGSTLAAWSEWIGNTLAYFWQWLSGYLFTLNGVREIINWLIYGWNGFIGFLGGIISTILDAVFLAWNSLLPFLLALWAATGGVVWDIMGLVADVAAAVWNLVTTIFWWLWANVEAISYIPLQFYYGFDTGINESGFSYLIACSGIGFWCAFLAGVQIVNQTVGQSVLYPIVIVGILLATLSIIWNNLWKMVSIDIR